MTNKKDFTHLHVHTEYSMLDGIIRIEPLIKHLKEHGMSSCAITDHGNMFGAVEFYCLLKEAGIKPILGCEAYITFDKDGIENKDKERKNCHLTLLAQNKTGWQNLLWLITNAHLNNFYYKPRVCFGNLQARSEGIIALTGCLAGLASRFGTYNKEEITFTDPDNAAFSMLQGLQQIFGDRLYAEIQDNAMWEQSVYNKWLLPKAKQLGIPPVITTDAHYLKHADHEMHSLAIAQQLGKTYEEYMKGDELRYGTGYYIRPPDEMFDAAMRHGAEEAFWNTKKVADRCELELTLGEYQNPMFDITRCDDYEDFLKWKTKNFSAKK